MIRDRRERFTRPDPLTQRSPGMKMMSTSRKSTASAMNAADGNIRATKLSVTARASWAAKLTASRWYREK